MKILWLYGSNKKWDTINHWYHMDWVRIIKQQSNIELMAYGWNLEKVWNDLAPISFNSIITAKDLKKEFDFDVIIMDNKNRFLMNSEKNKTKMWLDKSFFNNLDNTPKIMIEGDYHQHTKYWYKEINVDLLLHRHVSNIKRSKIDFPYIKSMWLPCSVDINKFKPDTSIQRNQLICFIGGWAEGWYPYRNLAAKILNPTNLSKQYKNRLLGQNYITCLQSYVSHLSCSSKYNITTAKMFEIMASGSVLLTDEGIDYGLKELFTDESYCTYKRDGSDVIEKTKLIINEPTYRDLVTKRAIQCITEKHTHEIRAQELIDIIEKNFRIGNSLFAKKEIPIKESKVFGEYTKNKLYNQLISLDIKFWLLEDSCLEAIIYHKLTKNTLHIGVQSSEIKELIESKIQDNNLFITIEPDRKIKKVNIIHEKGIYVPMPVITYLKHFTGTNWKTLLHG